MLVIIQSCEDRCLKNLTSCSQPIPSQKAKIKTLPGVALFQDYQVPKAHFKVNLEERARLEMKSNRIQVFKRAYDFAINQPHTSLCFAEALFRSQIVLLIKLVL